MSCPHVVGCPLYSHFSLKAALRVWQTNYCDGAYQRCARYQMSCAGDSIPATLLPNGKLLQLYVPLAP